MTPGTPDRHWLAVLLACALLPLQALAADFDERLGKAGDVVAHFRALPEAGIPPALLSRAEALVVIPGMIKVGFIVAGRHGSGVMAVRTEDGWSAPVFVKLSGGGVGWQAGIQASDLVLVFTNRQGVDNITSGKLTLGADASVAAGPLGRHTAAATDGRFNAEVYTYSRARGLFAGVSLEGASLRIDRKANAAYYVQPAITADDIIAGAVPMLPTGVSEFSALLPVRGAIATDDRAVASDAPDKRTTQAQADSAASGARAYAIGERAASEDDTER